MHTRAGYQILSTLLSLTLLYFSSFPIILYTVILRIKLLHPNSQGGSASLLEAWLVEEGDAAVPLNSAQRRTAFGEMGSEHLCVARLKGEREEMGWWEGSHQRF